MAAYEIMSTLTFTDLGRAKVKVKKMFSKRKTSPARSHHNVSQSTWVCVRDHIIRVRELLGDTKLQQLGAPATF